VGGSGAVETLATSSTTCYHRTSRPRGRVLTPFIFYARYTAKNLGGGVSDLSDTANNMQGVLQDRRTVLSEMPSGDFAKCKDAPPNNGELPVGASYQACALFLAPSGDTVTGGSRARPTPTPTSTASTGSRDETRLTAGCR
jgi:hypothetical protein